ncbi:MAG: hypothetical protein EXS06_03960, partial [Planctomycetaceae bacterium]|nr:hypothetical protein [Planctomycetaceae bacterium]
MWRRLPPLDAAAVDSGNRQRFLRSTGWKKVGDHFFHGYQVQITRASHVEPGRDGFWWAVRGPVRGPVLGTSTNKST